MTTRSVEQIGQDILRCSKADIPHQMWLTDKRITELGQHFYVAKVRGKVPLKSPSGDPRKTKYLCDVKFGGSL